MKTTKLINEYEIADMWKETVKIFSETKDKGPKATASKIIEKFGMAGTKEMFAVVAAIKKRDGRIYGENRKYLDNIQFDSKTAEWKSDNPVIRAGLDDIHTTHINQIITEIRQLDEKNKKKSRTEDELAR